MLSDLRLADRCWLAEAYLEVVTFKGHRVVAGGGAVAADFEFGGQLPGQRGPYVARFRRGPGGYGLLGRAPVWRRSAAKRPVGIVRFPTP